MTVFDAISRWVEAYRQLDEPVTLTITNGQLGMLRALVREWREHHNDNSDLEALARALNQ